jgi:serine/threonine protein kinase
MLYGVDADFPDRLSRALGPDFEVLSLLGQGGFADVYQIRDRRLDRTLAVKVLRPEIAWGPWMISRFEREARALASLNHLNIPPVHFVGDNEGLLYYIMPLIEGPSLADLLEQNGPLDPALVVDIMIPVLEALHHAHLLGIVHRDIKPDNIILEQGSGRPLLVDFGVAKQVKANSAGASLPGVIMGTPGYLSPEQAMAQDDIDARSDVYSAGATMFHLLTGSPTFDGENDREILGRQITGEIRVPHRINPGVSEWVSAVVVRALSRDRDARYQSAAAMAEALRIGRNADGVDQPTTVAPAERIREDDPTPKMIRAASVRDSAPPWQNRSSSGKRGVRRSRGIRSYSSGVIFLGLAGTVAAYFLLVPFTFTLRNNLLLPVEFSSGDGAVRTISPGEDLSLPLSQDGKLTARWFVVQPGPPAGEPVNGVIRLDALTAAELLFRRVRRSIDSWSDGTVLFAPRVRNSGSQPIRVTVSRVGGIAHCDCLVLPSEQQLLGYYRLEPSSFVRIEAAGGLSAVFRNLESRVDLNTGMLDLNVDDSVLSRPPK